MGHRAKVTAAGMVAWMFFVVAAYTYILLSPEHGSGMGGILYCVVGVYGGAIAILLAMLALFSANTQNRSRLLVIRLTFAASFFGLIGVVRYGSYLYSLDQNEAKTFVDNRIVEILKDGPDAKFPASQVEFVSKRPLPRLLRDQKFYFYDGGTQFHIDIRVDFDGGWRYSSVRPEWIRST